jgi:hypothetical protein
MVKEFLADEKAATAKYTNKTIQVDGVVDSTGGWHNDDHVSLKGIKKDPNDIVGLTVMAHVVPAQVNQAVLAGKGQKVQVVGKFMIGGATFGVGLSDCTFKELEPNKVPVVSPVDVTGEFVKDAKAAKAKYGDKEIIVEGTITDLVKHDGFYSVIMAGTAPAFVSCTIGEKDFATLKKGEKVKIKGDCSSFIDNQLTVNTAFVAK